MKINPLKGKRRKKKCKRDRKIDIRRQRVRTSKYEEREVKMMLDTKIEQK